MKKCPYCAKEIQDEAIKCKHCRKMLNNVPVFSYHAKDANGADKDGMIEAIDQYDAFKKLKEQGLYIISMKRKEAEEEKLRISESRLLANFLPKLKKQKKAIIIITGLVILFGLYAGYRCSKNIVRLIKGLDGFQGAKFDMKYEDVKKIILKEGKIITAESRTFANGLDPRLKEIEEASGLQNALWLNAEAIVIGEKTEIMYNFDPSSEKLKGVAISFNSRSSFDKVKSIIVKKYGSSQKDDGIAVLWKFRNGIIVLLKLGDGVMLQYLGGLAGEKENYKKFTGDF